MAATAKSRYITAVKWFTAFVCALLCAAAVCCFTGSSADAAAVTNCTVSGLTAKTYTGKAQTQSITVKYRNKTLKNGKDYTVSYQNNINAGTAYVIIKGKGSYSGTVKRSFTIKPAIIYKQCTFYKIASQYYTGSQIKPVPKIKNGTTTLKNGTDFTLTYQNNVNKGTAKVYIKGKGNYSGSCSLTFSITARPVSTLKITVPSVTYNGKAQKPAVTVKYNNYKFKNGTDYTLSYKNNTKIGTATVTVKGKGKLSGTKSVTFKINAKPIKNAVITYNNSLTYNGSTLSPAVTVKYGNATLKKNTDYTVAYSNNVNAGTGTITITGKGIYGGSVKKTFTIKKLGISASAVSGTGNKVYTGSSIKPVPAVKVGGRTLKNGTDFTVSYKNNTEPGTATLKVTGKGNYSGSVSKTFKITARAINDVEVTVPDTVFTGEQVRPDVVVSYGSYQFINNSDYTLSFKDNVNIGTASVVVTGKNHLSGSRTVTFPIEKADISSTEIAVKNATFTGSAVKSGVDVRLGNVTLKEGTHYTLSYKNNVNAGTAQVTISGKGSLEGAVTKDFTIAKADISKASISASGTYAPDGVKITINAKFGNYTLKNSDYSFTAPTAAGEQTLTISGNGNFSGKATVKCNVAKADIANAKSSLSLSTDGKGYTVTIIYDGVLLTQDKDYKVAVTESATGVSAVITGIGNYGGTATISGISNELEAFENAVVTIGKVTYNGTAQLPSVTVKIGSVTLKSGTDYILSAYDNTNAGTATAVITGKGKYEGAEKKTQFKIAPAAISSASISCEDQIYTGQGVTAQPVVTFNGKTLALGIDYYISGYSNIVNVGTATVTVKGKGNFTGTAKGTFRIVKQDNMETLVKKRLDEMMEGKWDRKIYDFWHSYQLGKYYNTLLTSPCTCHSYCETGNEAGCTCLIGRSHVLNNSGIQCAGFTIEVFEYLFGKTNGTGENTLTIRNRSDGNWTEAALKKWMTDTFRPGDYLAYDNIKYGYPHYVTIYSVDTDGIWVYEANYGGRCKINFRKFTFKEIYEETDGLWHRTPNNYELSEY
jgi:ribosomal 50S subunit-recycling heat shock protein